MYFVVLMGPAGSGKSHLADAFGDWLDFNELSSIRVNLDPAAEWLPYEPDVDIRRYVTARTIMEKYKLGPNGALVVAIDNIINFVDELRTEIESFKANYVIIDTPGQMELFAFRESGPAVLRDLIGDYKAVSVFLVDAVFASNPASLAASLFLAFSAKLRLRLPQVVVISKADLLDKDQMEDIEEKINDPTLLYNSLIAGGTDPAFAESVINALEPLVTSGLPAAIRFVSAVSMFGMEDLYAVIQQVLAGGEDFYTEEPNPRL
ncbi:MAG: ATP/GTP-binding protein [Pyrodictiaceae archaeon]